MHRGRRRVCGRLAAVRRYPRVGRSPACGAPRSSERSKGKDRIPLTTPTTPCLPPRERDASVLRRRILRRTRAGYWWRNPTRRSVQAVIPMKASHLQTHFHSWDKQGTERWTERPRPANHTQACADRSLCHQHIVLMMNHPTLRQLQNLGPPHPPQSSPGAAATIRATGMELRQSSQLLTSA